MQICPRRLYGDDAPQTPGGRGRLHRMTPGQRVAEECAQRGSPAVVAGCVDLLRGREVDETLVKALGGEASSYVLGGGDGGPGGHWPRVWGARGLLYVWEDSAAPTIAAATADSSWRVREMACKVIARHRVGDAVEEMAALRADPVPRVRAAADRALMILTESGA